MNQATSSPMRKLAAIMFTDIAGYTQSMSADEETVLNTLRRKRAILKPLIKDCNGTFVKEIGDGTLSYFPSAIDAATCAVKLQQATYDDADMNLRIGVHVGDIVFDDEDVFGDGVNVAARLESMAPVGGVCVSKSVFEELLNKKEFDGVPLGLQQLKGVGRLIDVFALKAKNLIHPDPKEYAENKVEPHSDDEVPSVAVLPLKNKGKEEDAFYAYGITADLIADLSRAGRIRVASMDDIEVTDAVNLTSKDAAKKLNVRYIVTGLLWKHEEVFQLAIEMIDIRENTLIWSDRWQEQWEELSTIKQNFSENLLKALNVSISLLDKAKPIQTNTEAYEYYLKGKYKYKKRKNVEDTEIARELFKKAIELDGKLIVAKSDLGWSYSHTGNYEKAMNIYGKALIQAKVLDDKRGIESCLNGMVFISHLQGEYDKALDYCTRTLEIREELGDKQGIGRSLSVIGHINRDRGQYDMARDYYNRSLGISEGLADKSGIASCLNGMGVVSHVQGEYDKALDYYTSSLEIREELGDKQGAGGLLINIGFIYYEKGEYDKALDYNSHSLEISEELGDKIGISLLLNNIGIVYLRKGEYNRSVDYLEKSLAIQNKIGPMGYYLRLETVTFLFLSYKHLSKKFDHKEIYTLIKEVENIEYEINYRIFELLENKSFLETAHQQIQEKAKALDDGKKFLSYPIPKAIVEAWESIEK